MSYLCVHCCFADFVSLQLHCTMSNLNMCFHAMTLVNTFGAAYTRLAWDAVQVKTIYLQFCAMYCCN